MVSRSSDNYRRIKVNNIKLKHRNVQFDLSLCQPFHVFVALSIHCLLHFFISPPPPPPPRSAKRGVLTSPNSHAQVDHWGLAAINTALQQFSDIKGFEEWEIPDTKWGTQKKRFWEEDVPPSTASSVLQFFDKLVVQKSQSSAQLRRGVGTERVLQLYPNHVARLFYELS